VPVTGVDRGTGACSAQERHIALRTGARGASRRLSIPGWCVGWAAQGLRKGHFAAHEFWSAHTHRLQNTFRDRTPDQRLLGVPAAQSASGSHIGTIVVAGLGVGENPNVAPDEPNEQYLGTLNRPNLVLMGFEP
jgi:hypothetical protein